MKISFEAIDQTLVTFMAGTNAAEGKVCKITANATVGGCGAGDAFCGVISHMEDGAAAAVLRGYVELGYTGTAPAVGYGKLTADGAGGVTAGAAGREYLIVNVDTAAKTVGLFL